jgi:hypothetical protein
LWSKITIDQSSWRITLEKSPLVSVTCALNHPIDTPPIRATPGAGARRFWSTLHCQEASNAVERVGEWENSNWNLCINGFNGKMMGRFSIAM